MQTTRIRYEFTAKPWQYVGPSSWTFISVPEEIAKEIKDNFKGDEEGWGRLKATAKIGITEWKTAIWFDTKLKTYLLPLKAEIRKREKIEIDKSIPVTVYL